MKNLVLNLPDQVRLGAIAKGKEGVEWLGRLDSLVMSLEHDWDLSVGQILAGGTEAFVAEVIHADGEQSVLKISVPSNEPSNRELNTLLNANGRGYVKLKRHDTSRGAILLERLGRQLNQMGLSIDAQIKIICETLKTAWRPLPQGFGLISGAEKASRLARIIEVAWRELGKPCSEKTIETALFFAQIRNQKFDPRSAVLGHGDEPRPN